MTGGLNGANCLTHELTGNRLDWAVAKAEGFDYLKYEEIRRRQFKRGGGSAALYCPSTAAIWAACGHGGELMHKQAGCTTALVAAMRCLATYKLGPMVVLPKELLWES